MERQSIWRTNDNQSVERTTPTMEMTRGSNEEMDDNQSGDGIIIKWPRNNGQNGQRMASKAEVE
jgi:hypothetical protein